MLGQICGQGGTKISGDLPNSQAKILPDDIHGAHQFHAHPFHHLLTCPYDDNQWFWDGSVIAMTFDDIILGGVS